MGWLVEGRLVEGVAANRTHTQYLTHALAEPLAVCVVVQDGGCEPLNLLQPRLQVQLQQVAQPLDLRVALTKRS